MTEKITITQIDAFTDRPFCGNPAAVCITAGPLPASLMQHIANEMNLAETAFLVRKNHGFHLRWFTPVTEVALCGHATLASAHVLWERGFLPDDERAIFHTLSGKLTADKVEDQIVLDFPAKPAREHENQAVRDLFGDMHINFLGKSDYDYFVVLAREADVINLQPDYARMAKIEARGFVVTARSENGAYDYISRFFAPSCGVNEDPVTGSAHCSLAHYWSEKLGRSKLSAYQASARGGYVGTEYLGERVKLTGKAITVMQAEMMVPEFEMYDKQ